MRSSTVYLPGGRRLLSMANSIFPQDELSIPGTEDRLDFSFNGAKDHRHSHGFAAGILDSYSCDHHYRGCCLLNDIPFDTASPSIQDSFKEISRLDVVENTVDRCKKERPYPSSLASFELLNNFGSGFKRLTGAKRIQPSNGFISIEARKASTTESGKLSAEETMRLAGETLIQSYSQTLGGFSNLTHPYHLSFSGLSEHDIKNVQLAQLLLAAAEKISQQQYERASRLLDQCDYYSDDAGNAVERVVYYFSEALRERIDRETGRISDKGLGKKRSVDMEEALMKELSVMASHEGTPFSKINQFAGIQAIVENVIESKKIHIIDIGVRFGMQWTLLMEALATRQDSELELLKITAVGTICENLLEETGKRLMSFAESKNLPLCYRIVMVSDFLDLNEELLKVESDETVAVFSEFILRSMLGIPNRLEHVIKIIATIGPTVMVIIEADANHNSQVFANRFIEALFFFSAYFDCFGECISDDEKNRKIIEGVMFGEGIRSMVAREGDERKIRNVKLETWRAFMERYGPEEMEFSMSSLYQANLLLKGCPNWRHCTLEMNGKGLVMCWKGVPINFVSVWKFA